MSKDGPTIEAAAGEDLSIAAQKIKGRVEDLCRDVIIERYDGGENQLLETSKNCVHECVRPVSYVRKAKDERPPAKQFAYELDPFQKAAVDCLELGESVLVAAHTSAGKTTVAEYAIAMALRDRSRVVYTSPIKALSNQKYRDLAEQFGDVGLMTGDVTLNPNASVIIMTTEILRSILYRGSELVREVRWVVFDEIHYMRDRDRGVVWEESIILLPDSVRQVFLSATIPNALEFAEWICRVKHQPCHVISTNYRPTPLQHFVFPSGSDGVLMVMDEKRNFKDENFRTALSKLPAEAGEELPGGMQPMKKKRRLNKDNPDLAKIIGMCHERAYTPVIVFAFSKMEVEANAITLNQADLTDDEEKQSIEVIFSNAVATLAEEDQNLPQIGAVLPMLMRGIGIHHGGLLPIVKEITELLFQEMLIKVLFSTETFSMGINMPAKTVIFSGLRKWDGVSNRMISPGEYIQMSGRAGRRGLDARGLSIVMVPPDIDADELKALFTGEPLRLDSHFYLKYNTLLNLLRVDGADPQYMLQRSFFQFQREKHTITLEEQKKRYQIQLDKDETLQAMLQDVVDAVGAASVSEALPEKLRSAGAGEATEDHVGEFVACVSGVRDLQREISSKVYTEVNIRRFLQRGRVLHIVENSVDWGYGILLSTRMARLNDGTPEMVLDVLLEVNATTPSNNQAFRLEKCMPADPGVVDTLLFGIEHALPEGDGRFEIFPCCLTTVLGICKIRANLGESPSKSDEFRRSCGATLREIRKRCGTLEYLDPLKDISADPQLLGPLIHDYTTTMEALKSNEFYGWRYAKPLFERFDRKVQVETTLRSIESQLQSSRSPQGLAELRGMEEVLRRLKYVDENNVVTFKGRISCDISTVDELIIGEILFENVAVSDLSVEYLCAMLSCLVHEDKPDPSPEEDPRLAELYKQVQSVAKRIADTSVASRLEIDPKAYTAKFTPTLMKATLRWMKGDSFAEIVKETKAYEGSIVRSFRRLEEALRDLASASKAMGSANLEEKFLQALKVLKRGIIFAASLYL